MIKINMNEIDKFFIKGELIPQSALRLTQRRS